MPFLGLIDIFFVNRYPQEINQKIYEILQPRVTFRQFLVHVIKEFEVYSKINAHW